MTKKFMESLDDPEFKRLYAIEGLLADAAETIWQLLVRRGMKQAELAQRLGKTPAFVSQILNGKSNMTVKTLAEVAHALGAKITIEAVDEIAAAKPIGERDRKHKLELSVSRKVNPFGEFQVHGRKTNSEAADPAASEQRSEIVA